MNNKRKFQRYFLILTLTVFTVLIYTGETEPEARLRGRDFVRLGEFGNISGTLKPDRGEWFLQTEELLYEIHLGDHEHRAKTGIKLEEGKKGEVTGYIYAQEGSEIIDVAVCTIVLDGKEYRFRNDDGTPLWRGRGGREAHGK